MDYWYLSTLTEISQMVMNQESLYFTVSTGDIDLLVSSSEQTDSFSGSTIIIAGEF